MNGELKPCPFCGGEAKMESSYDLHFIIRCRCTKCNVRTEGYAPDLKMINAIERIEECKILAIKDWNRRVSR